MYYKHAFILFSDLGYYLDSLPVGHTRYFLLLMTALHASFFRLYHPAVIPDMLMLLCHPSHFHFPGQSGRCTQ